MASTGYTLYVSVTGRESLPEMCPECLFSAIDRFTFAALMPTGVTTSTREICGVCKRREQGDG